MPVPRTENSQMTADERRESFMTGRNSTLPDVGPLIEPSIQSGSTSIRGAGTQSPTSTLQGNVDEDMRYATDDELEEFIRNHYGYMAGFMNNAEVRNVLFEAARNGWSEGRLFGAVSSTSWWQNTSAAQRTWQQLLSEDPAEATRQVNQAASGIWNRAQSLGLGLSQAQISAFATDAVANGWTDEQVVDGLLSRVNWSTMQGGDLTAARDEVREIGSQYLVDVSDQTAQNYANRMAAGELTREGVISIMAQQAKTRFGYIADQIDAGASVRDYFAPIQSVIARELEVAPDTINLMSPEWLELVETRDEKSGELRAATLHEAQLAARRKPQWAATAGAQEKGTTLVNMVSQVFGRSSV
jgi:hypothetical protein